MSEQARAQAKAQSEDQSKATIDPVALLGARFERAIASAFPDLAGGADALITPSRQEKLGDFQSNAAMPLAKRLGQNPREVAGRIVERLDLSGVAEPLTPDSIAGPGFINVRLLPGTLAACLARLDSPELGVTPPEKPRTIVVDLCGVNLAKEMHVGHLRATVIGDALARVFERLGERVIRQSHVGDWGLPIAMVAWRVRERARAGGPPVASLTLADLEREYRAAQAECKPESAALALVRARGGHPKAEAELELRIEDAEAARRASREFLVGLQGGDKEAWGVWQAIRDVTMRECLRICARLRTRITDEHSAGESSYAPELGPLVEDLVKRGVAEESEGALVVRVPGIEEPALIRKGDGGFLYATTDIAAVRRRVQKLGGDELVYCVDARQSLHFRQVFGAAEKAGYTTRPGGARARLEHAAFGMVLGEDGRPLKTRSGENVKLADLLDEAVERARAAVAAKNPGLSEDERREVAEAVAIAAIKYADLSSERIKDYVFSFDRMLTFEGNTGPYLLYALVRVRNILRRAGEEGMDIDAARGADLLIGEAPEKQLSLLLLRYPGVLGAVAESLEPHRLCGYLYDLATAYSAFYENCPVLKAPTEAVRASRLRLCAIAGRVLADGLETLGLPTPERM